MGNNLQKVWDSLRAGSGSFGVIEFCISIIFSFAIGMYCMFLYRIYFTQKFDRNENLARSFLIIAPSITAIFWAIQYSLPLSLGLLGALSFVRFRTPLKNPEDIGFILLVIALSLLSSVYRFIAAAVLMVLVTGVITGRYFIYRRLSFLRMGTALTAFVTTKVSDIQRVDKDIKARLTKEFENLSDRDVVIEDVVQKNGAHHIRYSVYIKSYNGEILSRMVNVMENFKDLDNVEVFRGNVA